MLPEREREREREREIDDVCVYMYIYVCVYIYICICVHVFGVQGYVCLDCCAFGCCFRLCAEGGDVARS